ncbi:MAG: YihY/virulence factor BrkB family protein [Oscillospiraceae bacterium]|nr:YihY/virulence factor BrkB family protein [Oscillospiraceae bacterium]
MHKNAGWRKLLPLARYISGLHIPIYASHAGFFIVLAVFPLLVLLLSLLRYTGLEVEYLTELLHGFLPVALMPAAQRLILNTYNSTSGTLISISAVAVLWSASRGIHGLVTGLNAIYGATEKRGYFQNRLISVVYTVLFLLVLLLTLVLAVFGESMSAWLFLEDSAFFVFLENVVDFRFFLLLFLQTALFCAMYMVLPSKANTLSDSFPGAVLASVGWLVFSDLYSVYVERFAGLSNVYGSVYGVALSMLWLYCCVSIVFYGGALNQWLLQKENKV